MSICTDSPPSITLSLLKLDSHFFPPLILFYYLFSIPCIPNDLWHYIVLLVKAECVPAKTSCRSKCCESVLLLLYQVYPILSHNWVAKLEKRAVPHLHNHLYFSCFLQKSCEIKIFNIYYVSYNNEFTTSPPLWHR